MQRTILGLAALALAVLACGGPEGVNPGPDLAMIEPTHPVHVLNNISMAFEARHPKILTASLCDDFRFHFCPEDVGATVNGYVIPESWTRDEFYAAAANIFAEAYDVDCNLYYRQMGSPAPGETEFRGENVETWFEVSVDRYTEYETYGGYCDFDFRGYAPGDGKTYWRVARWWDRTYVELPGDAADERTTLGRILAMFHEPPRGR
jgi:hypothetical protein